MAAKKKIAYPSMEPKMDWHGCQKLMTSAGVNEVLNSRFADGEKLRRAIASAETPVEKKALQLAHDVLYNEITELGELRKALQLLETPYIAAWIELENNVEKLKCELNRITAKIPE
jgi:hypothetical protein